MTKKKKVYSIVLLIALITSTTIGIIMLSDPMEKKITKDNYDSILEDIRKKSDKKDFEKVQAIVLSLTLANGLGGKDPIEILKGKSFRDHIEKFKNQEKRSKCKRRSEQIKSSK